MDKVVIQLNMKLEGEKMLGNDLTVILTTIASVSAGFVAILGGFIASRLIEINSQRSMCKSILKEIEYKKFFCMEEKNMHSEDINEEKAAKYIFYHIEELADRLDLDDVYMVDELNDIDSCDLEPLWEEAKYYIDEFENYLEDDGCEFNSDMIPAELAEDIARDVFIYEVLKIYSEYVFSEDCEVDEFRSRGSWYERSIVRLAQLDMQIVSLEIEEFRCKMDLQRLKKPKGMEGGLMFFAVFTVSNIILPLLLGAVDLPECMLLPVCICGFLLFCSGLVGVIVYLFRLLRWGLEE